MTRSRIKRVDGYEEKALGKCQPGLLQKATFC